MDRSGDPHRGLCRLEDFNCPREAMGSAIEEDTLMFINPYNPHVILRRFENPSRGTKIALGIALAVIAGGAVYFSTRRTAAASEAARAFSVTPGCSSIKIVDEGAARASVTAAAIVVHPAPGDSAVAAAQEILAVLFPSCEWSTIPDDREFIHGGQSYSWGDLKPLLVGRTVGEVTSMVTGGMQSSSSPLPSFFSWILTSGRQTLARLR